MTSRPALLVGAVAAALLAVALAAALTASGAPRQESTDAVRLGPPDGSPVARYVDAAAAGLAAAAADEASYALVTLTGYVTPDGLAGTVGTGTGVATVRAIVRVPLPRVQTAVLAVPAVGVPADVRRGMGEAADRLAAQGELSAAQGGDPVSAAVAAAQVGPLRAGCACVYAVVVRATGDGLRALSARPGVRVVEVAPAGQELARLAFAPLLPEQTITVTPPADDGAAALTAPVTR